MVNKGEDKAFDDETVVLLLRVEKARVFYIQF